MTRWQNNI